MLTKEELPGRDYGAAHREQMEDTHNAQPNDAHMAIQ